MIPAGLTIDGLLQVVTNVGLPGIVLLMYYLDQKANARIMTQYRNDMIEQRDMYDKNVDLVKQYCDLAKDMKAQYADLKDIILLNTQAWNRTYISIESNLYCPQVRLEKKSMGVQR